MNRSNSKYDWLSLVWGMLMLFLIIIVWEISAQNSIAIKLLFSSPFTLINYIGDNYSKAFTSLAYTGGEAVLGLFLAIFVSISFASLFLYFPSLSRIVYPWLLTSQIIPFVCLAPLVILVFGTGVWGKVFLSGLMAFFPLLTNLVTGIKSVPRSSLELMMIMKSTRLTTLRHVIVPYSLRYFFAGLRVATPFSVIGAIVAEFNGADYGVGKDMFIAAKRLEPEVMMIGIISGALISAVIYLVVLAFEANLGSWYKEN